MTPQRWRRLKSLFGEAAEQSSEGRAGVLRRVSENEPSLQDDLAALLAANLKETLPFDPAGAQILAANRLFQDGEVLLDRFKVVRFLDAGGMGEVYEALDKQTGGRVALKTVRRDIAFHPEILERLKAEIQLARQITSPHVCRLHEFFRIPAANGRPELACFNMELLDGRSLADHIKQHAPLTWTAAAPTAFDICKGLIAIHSAGFIHRDFKPGNVMLVERAGRTQAVVMDFGLAQRMQPAALAVAAGGAAPFSGGVAGTPPYMAPEQFQDGNLTPATDVYALGIVLYEMICGHPPYAAGTPLGAAAQSARPLPRLPHPPGDLPPDFERTLARCLEFDPVRRYQSVDQVVSALDPRRVVLRRRRRAIAAAATASIVLAIVLFFVARPPIYRPNENALFWYNRGVSALHEGAYVEATNSLQKALEDDSSFILAHARLAEAWSELDFTGKADREMLLAASVHTRARLPALDNEYLEAIREYVTEDFTGAVKTYASILNHLPTTEKAAGYLDLARAEEKAGNVDEALAAYTKAAQQPPESPASLLRRAILESRRNQSDRAERDYAEAADLYHAGGNYEGLAEVDFQRGYSESTHAHPDEAVNMLEKSLQASEEIGSPQLQIRALARLAVVAYGQGKDDKAIELASQAIELAHERGLDYWAIDARIRRANAYGDKNDFGKADTELKLALSLAEEAKSPRLAALANFSLASLRDQQHDPDDTILYATRALDYYRRAHFDNEALQCLTLVDRGNLTKGDYAQALANGTDALVLAKKTGNPSVIYPAEELLGQVLLETDHYSDALEHFQAGLAASRASGEDIALGLLHCASVLSRLGRYSEALSMIDSVPPSSRLVLDVSNSSANVSAELNLSRGLIAQALQSAKLAAATAHQLGPEAELDSVTLYIRAAIASGDTKSALAAYREGLEYLPRVRNPALIAAFRYAAALILQNNGETERAEANALDALSFFESAGQWEEELFDVAILSRIAIRERNTSKARQNSQKGLDILDRLSHNWDPKAYREYVSRADVKTLARELSATAER